MSIKMDQDRRSYNVLVSGPQGSGKTSFIHSLLNRNYSEIYEPTIGFNQYNIELLQFPPTKIRIWDMSGDPKYELVCKKYCPDIDLNIIVTTDSLDNYIKNVPTIVIWSKSDIIKTYPPCDIDCVFEAKWSSDNRSLANRSISLDTFKYKLASTLINLS